MAKIVQRPKLSLLERLFLPTLWNGFKVTLGHFLSWKKSSVYEDKNKDNQFKTTLSYPLDRAPGFSWRALPGERPG